MARQSRAQQQSPLSRCLLQGTREWKANRRVRRVQFTGHISSLEMHVCMILLVRYAHTQRQVLSTQPRWCPGDCLLGQAALQPSLTTRMRSVNFIGHKCLYGTSASTVQDLGVDAPWRPTRRPIFQSEQQSMHACNATVDPMHVKKGEDEKAF